MPLEAPPLDEAEDAFHLMLVVDVFREDVFIERVAGRAMHEQQTRLAVDAGQFAEELPAAFAVLAGFKLLPSPKIARSAVALKPSGSNKAP